MTRPESAAPADGQPVGVIDIGSNSGRLVVVRLTAGGHLDVTDSVGAPLRLVHDLATGNTLSEKVMERTQTVLEGFQSRARGAGAAICHAVATSAVRDAGNGAAFVERLERATGLSIQIVGGEEEARHAFHGAIYGLPVENGLLVDVGGGSAQFVSFRDRRVQHIASLPLGALRLSDRFLASDPPTQAEMRKLTEHVGRLLRKAGVPRLAPGEQLVGTGGTIRNIAKIARAPKSYPISRLHGYTVGKAVLEDAVGQLARRPLARRAEVPGLNPSRADSIIGGSLCVSAAMRLLGATELLVSGAGLREGIALSAFGCSMARIAEVKRASLTSLAQRFATWNARDAKQRVRLAGRLASLLDPAMDFELQAALSDAAFVLDIGLSISFYGQHGHTVNILLAADLDGFSHREVALRAALVRLAGKKGAGLKAYTPLMSSDDQAPLDRAATILSFTDALTRLAPRQLDLALRREKPDGDLVAAAPWLSPWALQEPVRRVQQVFGCHVRLAA